VFKPAAQYWMLACVANPKARTTGTVKNSLATESTRRTPMKAMALSAFIGVYRRLIGFFHGLGVSA